MIQPKMLSLAAPGRGRSHQPIRWGNSRGLSIFKKLKKQQVRIEKLESNSRWRTRLSLRKYPLFKPKFRD